MLMHQDIVIGCALPAPTLSEAETARYGYLVQCECQTERDERIQCVAVCRDELHKNVLVSCLKSDEGYHVTDRVVEFVAVSWIYG